MAGDNSSPSLPSEIKVAFLRNGNENLDELARLMSITDPELLSKWCVMMTTRIMLLSYENV